MERTAEDVENTKPVTETVGRLKAPSSGEPGRTHAVGLIIDYHHHYRSMFFMEMAKRLDIFVAFTSPSGLDRQGLASNIPLELQHQTVTRYQYERVLRRPWGALVAFVKTMYVVLKHPAPIWIIHGYSNPACYAGIVAKWLFGCKLIMWGESNYQDHKRYRPLEWFKGTLLRYCDQVHVYGQSARDYCRWLGVPASRIYIVQPTIDERPFVPFLRCRKDPGRRRKVLYVGRFSPEKNLPRLLESLREHREVFPRTGLSLTMVGFGAQEEELREFVSSHAMQDLVTIRDKVQPGEVAKVMSEHDALILPSVQEAYGLVVLEAQWTGLPVAVSTRCGCVRDLVNPANGWLIDPGHPGSLQRVWSEIERCGSAEWEAKSRAAVATAQAYSSARSVALTLAAIERWMRPDASQGLAELAAEGGSR